MNKLLSKFLGKDWEMNDYIFFPILVLEMLLLVTPAALLLGGFIKKNYLEVIIGGVLLFIEMAYATTLDKNGFKKSDTKKWDKKLRRK